MKRIWSRSEGATLITGLLSQANPKADLPDRVLWLEHVLRWLKGSDEGEDQAVRLRYILQVLEKNPEWKTNVSNVLRTLLRDSSFLRLFLQTGFAIEGGLWTELTDRIFHRFLPEPPENDFLEIVSQSLIDEEDAEWIRSLPEASLGPLQDLLNFGSMAEGWRVKVDEALSDSLLILAANIAHYGLTTDLRRRHAFVTISQSPFLRLQEILLENLRLQNSGSAAPWSDLDPVLGLCRQAIAAVYKDMETSGVSVALVFRLEVIKSALDRVEALRSLLVPASPAEKRLAARDFFARLVAASVRRRSIRGHLREHLYLLSRKIVERNGFSGEHYSFRKKSEFFSLFVSGIGGGIIVVFMTLGKMLLHDLHLPSLIYAFGAWFIYSAGFLAMQFSGGTLATKLPSFVASHLASQLRGIRDREHLKHFVSEVRYSSLSQLIAFLGNLCGLIPIGVLLTTGLTALGIFIISPVEAQQNLADLNPLLSMAIPLGALTGVELWLSSLAGGWFENWIVFRRLPLAIQHHALLKRAMGKGFADKVSEWLLKNSSGIAGNLALGFLFGFVPFWGSVVGLNLESKHVTISSTGAVISMSILGLESLSWTPVLVAIAGLICIGIMNFAVSFTFALIVAARASNIKRKWLGFAFSVIRNKRTRSEVEELTQSQK